jgi:hypothetical protein
MTFFPANTGLFGPIGSNIEHLFAYMFGTAFRLFRQSIPPFCIERHYVYPFWIFSPGDASRFCG